MRPDSRLPLSGHLAPTAAYRCQRCLASVIVSVWLLVPAAACVLAMGVLTIGLRLT